MPSNETFSERVRQRSACIAENGVGALAGLYDLTAQRLVRYAVTITRNQHDAEDVIQSVLVRVAQKSELITNAEAPWPYLLRMVRNEALVILRKKKRWSVLNALNDLITRSNTDELEKEDTYRAVWQAIRKLPVEQREVVVLKIWEDLTFAEIAGVLELSAATVASRYRYAISKLTTLLDRVEPEVVHE